LPDRASAPNDEIRLKLNAEGIALRAESKSNTIGEWNDFPA